MWCAGRNGRKGRKHDNECGGASGLGKAFQNHVKVKGQKKQVIIEKEGINSVIANCKGEAARSASPHLRCVDLALVGLNPPLSYQKALVEHLCVNIMCQDV